MAPRFSIIIPHKSTFQNDRALSLNLDMLVKNTRDNNFEIIIDTTYPKDPYKIWNEASRNARANVLVFSNSDVLMGPDWDDGLVDYAQPNSIVTGYLIEPGNVGVAVENIQCDFGRTPDSFDRVGFEGFARQLYRQKPVCAEQRGWYMPCAVDRDWFLSTGGFDTTLGFPNPNDILFWERCIHELGTKLLRTNSIAYHFQALSLR